MSEKLTVRLAWGQKEMPEVKLRDGQRYVFETDGPLRYELFELDWDRGALTIKPRCLMIAATPAMLRKYAEILDHK